MMIQLGNIVDLEKKIIFYGKIVFEDGILKEVVNLGEEKLGEVYVMPGFVDSHIHIESSMVTPLEFAKVAVRTGVVATVSDPHEIANVLGFEGMEYMRLNGLKSGFKFFFGVPSCVPAAPFDRSGCVIDENRVDELLSSGDYYFLAEMMNFPGVINGDVLVMKKINSALKRGFKVDGHAPGLTGDDIVRYVSSGISTDHECMDENEALKKISLGMKIQIREGSAAKNFDSLIKIAIDNSDNVMLCSDDCHPDDLMDGYFVELIRRSIRAGVSLFDALKISGYNAIKHYDLPVGLLQKGDSADYIVVEDLSSFKVQKTVVNGVVLYENDTDYIIRVNIECVNNFVQNYIEQKDLNVLSSICSGKQLVKVIETIEGELYTKCGLYNLDVVEGVVKADLESDILKIVVLNRYLPAKPSIAFIKGFGLKEGAICSSVAHDSHNIVAVGVDDESIVKVINAVVDVKGGLAYADSSNLNVLELPVAGIMSDLSVEQVAEKYTNLLDQTRRSGSKMKAPFMTMAFMSLIVIPELKLSDQGLFDVVKFEPTSLFDNE